MREERLLVSFVLPVFWGAFYFSACSDLSLLREVY